MKDGNSNDGLVENGSQLRDIARLAAERSTARLEAESRRMEQTRVEHARRFHAAVVALDTSVIPLLEQAKVAFESEGVPTRLSTNFDNAGASQACVTFDCSGSFWSDSHGQVDLAVSDRAVFYHDGTDFFVGIAKSYSDQAARRSKIEGDIAPAILSVVEQVVESFFLAVERRCRH